MIQESTKAKIIATIGPASRDEQSIRSMFHAGVRVFRLNFSHGKTEDHRRSTSLIRKVSDELHIPVAIFQDLQGPKIRIGALDVPQLQVKSGEQLTITTEQELGTHGRISIDYPYLHEEVYPDSRILIDDGLIALEVQEISGRDIQTIVRDGGAIKPRKGVNLPGIPLHHLASFTDKDKADLDLAFALNLEYVALSFVRSAQDVQDLKQYMGETYGREIPVIAKIEKPEAVHDIQGIIEASSAVMIARGDLGVETSPEEVPIIQKSIIRSCNLAGIPVITATQMLESMISHLRPTRAEAADVANAVLDGSSALMLSGETAAGANPLQAVEIMKRIIKHTESSLEYQRLVLDQRLNREDIELNRKKSTTEAVGLATREMAQAIRSRCIACFTQSGSTARLISKFRPDVPIIGFSPVAETVRRLALSWGVYPVLIGELSTVDELLSYAPEHLQKLELIAPGDTVVVTAGVPVGSPGKTNMIKVVEAADMQKHA